MGIRLSDCFLSKTAMIARDFFKGSQICCRSARSRAVSGHLVDDRAEAKWTAYLRGSSPRARTTGRTNCYQVAAGDKQELFTPFSVQYMSRDTRTTLRRPRSTRTRAGMYTGQIMESAPSSGYTLMHLPTRRAGRCCQVCCRITRLRRQIKRQL
jgi:hypothetical protein